jgi:hypothetical protein
MGMRCAKFADIIRTTRRFFALLIEHPRGRVVGEESKQHMSERQECGRTGPPLVAGQAPHRGPWTCAQYMAGSAKA